MCDLCVEVYKLKQLKAFHLHFVALLSQQDFGCDRVRTASALSYTTVNPVELPKIENGLEANLSYAVYYKYFPSVVKNAEKMNKVPFLLSAQGKIMQLVEGQVDVQKGVACVAVFFAVPVQGSKFWNQN